VTYCSPLLVGIALFSFLVAGTAKVEGPPYVRTPASSDMQAFEKYVNLPEKPKAVTFETFYRAKPSRAPGPMDWSLMAVLTYDPAALERIKERARQQKDPVMLDSGEVRPWFPQTIKDALVSSSRQGSRFAGTAYKAKPFLKPPLNDGEFAVPDGSNYLFLQMDCCGPITELSPGK
jgi:hypothetical protein